MYRLAVIQHAQAALVRRNVNTVWPVFFACLFRYHAETAGTFGGQDAQQKRITKSTFAIDHRRRRRLQALASPHDKLNAPA